MSVLYQNPTDQSVQSQKQVYKKAKQNRLCVDLPIIVIFWSQMSETPFHSCRAIRLWESFFGVNLNEHEILHYNYNSFHERCCKKFKHLTMKILLTGMRLQGANDARFEYFSNSFFSAKDRLDWMVIVSQIAEQETSEKSLPLQSPISRVIGPENTHLWYRALIHHAVTHFFSKTAQKQNLNIYYLSGGLGGAK